MPKKIDVSKDKILDITDRILQKDGYKALSVRKARKSAAHLPSARSQRLRIVGKKNNVTLITAEHMDIINDKRAKEKKQK